MNGYLDLQRRVRVRETRFVEFESQCGDFNQSRLSCGEKSSTVFFFVDDQAKLLLMLESVNRQKEP